MNISTAPTGNILELNGHVCHMTGSPTDLQAVCAHLHTACDDYTRVEWIVANGATVEPVGVQWRCHGDGFNSVGDTWREAVDGARGV